MMLPPHKGKRRKINRMASLGSGSLPIVCMYRLVAHAIFDQSMPCVSKCVGTCTLGLKKILIWFPAQSYFETTNLSIELLAEKQLLSHMLLYQSCLQLTLREN